MKKEFLTTQIMRMSGLDFFPPDSAGLTELSRTLGNCAASEDHARRIIDRWIEKHEKCAKPMDLAAVAADIPVGKVAPEGCGKCLRGWRSFERLERDSFIESQNATRHAAAMRSNEPFTPRDSSVKISYTARCNCALGVYLEAEWQRHQHTR